MNSFSKRRAAGRPIRVLLLSQWFDAEPTYKGILFAKKLQDLGFDVRALTSFPNYPGEPVHHGHRLRLFRRQMQDAISVLRVSPYASHDNSKVSRALNYGFFAVSAACAALFIRRPDVAYVSHPSATIALAAWSLKFLRGVPFVYDVQDVRPDTTAAIRLVTRPSIVRLVGRVNSLIYKGATRIVVPSPTIKQKLFARGVPELKIDVIANWVDEDQIDYSALGSSPSEAQFTVTFAGNFGRGKGLESLLDSACLLEDEVRARFLFVGSGCEAQTVKEAAGLRGLTNVQFLSGRSMGRIGESLASADLLLMHSSDNPLFGIMITSMAQAHFMADAPILMGVHGDAAQVIKDTGAGFVFDEENSKSLADAVRRVLMMEPEERAAMGRAASIYYRENLSLEVGSRSLARVLGEVSFARPRANVVKRIFDVVVSAIGLIVLSVPLAVVGLLVRWKIGRPVFFRQVRPGRDADPINMFKFRTMTDARDSAGDLLLDKERLTRFGAFLRASSLDEIPELWNVLRGDMSLVGPRPLLMRYSNYFTLEERLRFRVRPGITGWAQVNGRNTASWSQRLALDVWYVKNQSLWLDAKILALTVAKVIKKDGVVVDAESTMRNLDDERKDAATTK